MIEVRHYFRFIPNTKELSPNMGTNLSLITLLFLKQKAIHESSNIVSQITAKDPRCLQNTASDTHK